MHGIKRDAAFMMEYGYTLAALFFAAMVALALAPSQWYSRWCTAPWLRFLGRYSYGLYILHSVLPAFYGDWLPGLLLKVTRNQTLANAALVVAEASIALGAAMLSYHFLEQPFLRLKRYFPSFPAKPRRGVGAADGGGDVVLNAGPLVAEADGTYRG
jgi:peptidoglycan/LPS O-acetylase OafA/YrhL